MQQLIRPPLSYRRGIPFHVLKPEAAFSADPYEDYSGQVVRQLTLHLGKLAGLDSYPWQSLEDWVLEQLSLEDELVVEVGSSCGKLIASIALKHPKTKCFGFDYSYQLTKVANHYWCQEKPLEWASKSGFGSLLKLPARPKISNLYFGVANADHLPFEDNSLTTIISTFLIDRVADLEATFNEWYRLLKPGGKVILASPLNWQDDYSWQNYHPVEKLIATLVANKWTVILHPTRLLQEPLDRSGNSIIWNCACMVWHKH